MRLRGSAIRIASAVSVSAAVVLLADPVSAGATRAEVGQCGAWEASQVAAGYGMLESVAFDGRGGMLLSEQAATGSGGGIQRLEHSGARSTVVSGVDGAGKIMVSGDVAYYTTGLSLQAKLSGQTGSIQAIDLDSGQVSTVAAGLQMPNGLAQLPDGDFVVSSDLGIDTRVIRVHDGASVGPFSSKATSTNGIAYDPARRRLYVATTFTPATTIAIFDIDKPDNPSLIELPGPGPLNAADGLTIGPDGDVYLAYSIGGKVLRVDPDNGGWCTIAENLPLTTGVHFGDGAGWDSDSLYAVSYLGTVTRLSPTR